MREAKLHQWIPPTAMDNEDAQLSPAQTPLVKNLMRPANEGEGKEQMYPSWIRVPLHPEGSCCRGCAQRMWVHFAWGPIGAGSMGQGRKRCWLHECSGGQWGLHTPGGAWSKDGDFDLSGEVPQYRHHLYVNVDHLDGNHELGGPIRGGGPSGGQG